MTAKSGDFLQQGIFLHKLVGLWHKNNDQSFSKHSKVKSYVIAFIAFAFGFGYFSTIKRDLDVEQTAIFALDSLGTACLLIKVLPFVIYRKSIIELLHVADEIGSSVSYSSEEEIKIVDSWRSIQTTITKNWIRFYVGNFILHFAMFLAMGYSGFPICGSMASGNFLNVSIRSFVLRLMIIALGIPSAIILIAAIISLDILSIAFLCQLCSEFELVEYSLKKLKKGDEAQLFRVIERHSYALEYGRKASENLTSVHCVVHFFSVILTCFAAAVILKSSNIYIYVEVGVVGASLLLKFLAMCVAGETLMSKSLNVAHVVECEYATFLGDQKTLKLMRFILLRAQKPVSLTVFPNCTLNLSFFLATMNKAVSLFMILKVVLE